MSDQIEIEESPVAAHDPEFEHLLNYLKVSRGFDFTAYKRTTLSRRVQKRMQSVGVETYNEYLDYLEVHQDEFPQLFNTILINVTSFFRDTEAWEYLTGTVVPKMLEAKGPIDPIRVWIAGCASGEEAYSIAMVLAEALGAPAFRERVKIYATDLDDDALTSSRFASYSEKDVQSVPAELLSKYFERVGERLTFDRDLRRSIIFGRHDLIQDAPISRVDLLQCRNTLMYFNAETQERILSRFHFALNDGGYLFLGKAETLLTHAHIFSPIDLRHRVFSKVPHSRVRDRFFMYSPSATAEVSRPEVNGNGNGRLRDAAFQHTTDAQIVIDASGRLHSANERARQHFGIHPRDMGRPIQDLEISFRPVELRSSIEQAQGQRRPVHHREVSWKTPGGDALSFDLAVVPLLGDTGEYLGTMVTFEDTTGYKRLQTELQNFNQELETAYEEVQSTNEELQTTNEELQSTVEELETTNEELQSTNEELETMNEELQSANEELETINEELRQRSLQLNRANSFLESILGGLQDGVIVLDGELQVLAWNHRSEDLWGLRSEEAVGKHLLNLDMGLPLDQLRTPIRTVLASSEAQELSLSGLNRRGRETACRIVLTPLQGYSGEAQGVIVLMTCQAP